MMNEYEKAVLDLPFEYRMVYSLHQLDGFSVQETAELLNLSENEVTERLEKANELIKTEKINTGQKAFEFNLIYCDSMVDEVMKRIKD